MTDICPPADAAAWFINRVDRDSGENMTHLKVQKLLYFAQAYYLANYSKPLFDEDFEAWAHGPVLRSVFDIYSEYAWHAIEPVEAPQIDNKVINYLEAVYDKFGKFSAKELERISHVHDPWRDARGELPPEARCNTIIPKNEIEEFYAKRIKKKKQAPKRSSKIRGRNQLKTKPSR